MNMIKDRSQREARPDDPDHRPLRAVTTRAIAAAAVAGSLVGLASTAQARTCAVEVEELREIRRLALDLVGQNVRIEPGRAAAAQKKVMQALQNGGSISIDPADLKGIVSLKGKPSKAAVRQLLGRVQKIFESCNI
jgi:hypothetical protein